MVTPQNGPLINTWKIEGQESKHTTTENHRSQRKTGREENIESTKFPEDNQQNDIFKCLTINN